MDKEERMINKEQQRIIDVLRKAAQTLKEKGENTMDEASEMVDSSYEYAEAADKLESGGFDDIETALYILESPQPFDITNVIHIDPYDLTEIGDLLDNIHDEATEAFPTDYEDEEDE